MNSNVDQYGIPRSGFLKADKLRAHQQREQGRLAGISVTDESPRHPLYASMMSSRASVISVAVLVISMIILAGVQAKVPSVALGSSSNDTSLAVIVTSDVIADGSRANPADTNAVPGESDVAADEITALMKT